MAVIVCKGTVLQQEISSVLTAVAQVINLDLPESETETFEADTLDNSGAGIPHKVTGRVEGGSLGAELFFDPALAGHQALTDVITTPASQVWKIIFADSGTTEWDFTTAGIGLGGTVALNDGLKATLTAKLDGMVTYPT